MTKHEYLDSKYAKQAKEYAAKWNVDDPHVIHIIKSVMMHRDDIIHGGSFVRAVVDNNLSEAVGRADSTCLKYLNVIVAAKMNSYVESM